MTREDLEKDMCLAMADLLGRDFVPAYYQSAASDFIQIAEYYAQEKLKDFKKKRKAKKERFYSE